MKIALAYPRFYPNIGGIETYMAHLAEEYHKAGHNVAVFTSEPFYLNQPEFKTKEGYRVAYLPAKPVFNYPLPDRKAAGIIGKFNPDIIHLNGPHPYSTMLARQVRKLKKPVIATYHGHANPSSTVKKIVVRAERLGYRFLFKKLIVTSGYYKKAVSGFYPGKRIEMVPLGIDTNLFNDSAPDGDVPGQLGIPDYKNLVLFVGAMDDAHYYKGIPVLLETAAKTPDIHYLLIGGGSKKAAYMKHVRSSNIANVSFLNPVPAENLPMYYKAADIVVLPSTSNSEGFGLVLLEAMACGTPVISTGVAGSAEMIKNAGAGIIVKANDADSLKEGIITLLYDNALRTKLINSGMKLASSMTWTGAAQKNLQIYEKLISTHGRATKKN